MASHKMLCPKCKGDGLEFTAQCMFNAPIEFYRNMSKAAFRKASVVLYGVDWGKAEIWCPQCGFTSSWGPEPGGEVE